MSPSNLRLLRRALVTTPFALALLAGSLAVSIAGVTRYDNPEVALRFMPGDAVANARLADQLLQTGSAADRPAVLAAADRSLRRSPLSPSALRIEGLLADEAGNHVLAARRIGQAAALTRRDLGTQLWLIEDAVARNDVPGALDHFDIALRTSAAARPILFPVLANAIADPEYRSSFAQLFERRSGWQRDFIVTALQAGQATENIAAILTRLPPASDAAQARALVEPAVTQAMNERRYALLPPLLASPLARSAGLSGTGAEARRLTGFGDVSGVAPFTWLLASEASFGASTNGNGLDVTADSGNGGVVASRALLLPAGRYVLATTGSVDGDVGSGRIAWTMTCAGVPERPLTELPLAYGSARAVSVGVSIGPDCPAQWLRLSIAPTGSAPVLRGSVAAVTVAAQPKPGL